MQAPYPKKLIGAQEWCALPELTIPALKAKIDTGAKTAALHAVHFQPFWEQGELNIQFCLSPLVGESQLKRLCTAPVLERRWVTNSGGEKERRFVIQTLILLGRETPGWEIEVTLTNRDPMRFRMLLGRDALKGRVVIDPEKRLCLGQIKKRALQALYLMPS